MFKKYYIKSKIRFTISITVMLLIILLCGSVLFRGNYAESSSRTTYYAITVESGDTLWSIAGRYSNQRTDIRRFIYEISVLNNLESSEIIEGQKLLIPA